MQPPGESDDVTAKQSSSDSSTGGDGLVTPIGQDRQPAGNVVKTASVQDGGIPVGTTSPLVGQSGGGDDGGGDSDGGDTSDGGGGVGTIIAPVVAAAAFIAIAGQWPVAHEFKHVFEKVCHFTCTFTMHQVHNCLFAAFQTSHTPTFTRMFVPHVHVAITSVVLKRKGTENAAKCGEDGTVVFDNPVYDSHDATNIMAVGQGYIEVQAPN